VRAIDAKSRSVVLDRRLHGVRIVDRVLKIGERFFTQLLSLAIDRVPLWIRTNHALRQRCGLREKNQCHHACAKRASQRANASPSGTPSIATRCEISTCA